MVTKRCYLKPSVKVEPLVWKWYAWPYLIAPATAAMYLSRHIKIMQSYITAPHIHAMAAKAPELIGGAFIDLEEKYLPQVQDLLEKTNKNCGDLIKLADALKTLDLQLQAEAKGFSLEGFYKNLPEELKGCVELTYDINNNPSIRLIEALIYQTYYKDTWQSIALSDTNEDFRPFSLSTPRLEKPHELHLDIAFSDSRIDTLFAMRDEPQEYEHILKLLNIPPEKEPLFNTFFTEQLPNFLQNKEPIGNDLRVRYFGHACVLLETKDISILIDPLISYDFKSKIERFTFSDLPEKIDYVLITHNHQDHLVLETLLQLRDKIKNIVLPTNLKGSLIDPSLKLILKNTGFNSIILLDEMEKISLPDGEIVSLPFLGEHTDLNIQTKSAYYVKIKANSFLFAADSNNLDNTLYNKIVQHTGPIDNLFIGMECEGAPLSWFYGPLLSQPLTKINDESRRFSGSNFEKAWEIVKTLKCQRVYVYAMGLEPWLTHMMALNYSDESLQIKESNRLIETCLKNNIESERLYLKKQWIYNL